MDETRKTVLITGCSSGIGRASARLFAEKGWNVVVTMRDPSKGKDLEANRRVLLAKLDVEERESIDWAIEAGIAKFGRIDAVINSAGYGQYGLFEAVPREKMLEQFAVNVFGVMDVIRALLPHFRRHKNGTIINVSSGAGIFTLPMISLYCASKFALEGFSEALSYELASQNITVKIIEPHGGVTNTDFNERSAADSPKNEQLTDYDEFVKNTSDAFASMLAARSISSEEVAETIYNAATDGTDRLRYLIGNDTRGFIKARQELSEQEYIELMRSYFKL